MKCLLLERNMNTREKVLTKQILFLATPEDQTNLKELAHKNRLSMGEMLRKLINKEVVNLTIEEEQLDLI